MIQIHMHSLGTDRQETHWSNATVNERQRNTFGQNALFVLLSNFWCPVRPTWADGECTEIRFIGDSND